MLRLATEIDNLRAAVMWSLDATDEEDGELALHIIADVTACSFEDWSGVWLWAELAIERARCSGPVLRSMVLAVASSSAFYRTDYVKAHELAREALRDGVASDSPGPELPYMALMVSSRPQRIQTILAEGLAAVDAVGAGPYSHARLHCTAAGCAAQAGDLEFAAAEAKETLRIGQELHRRSVTTLGLSTWWRLLRGVHHRTMLSQRWKRAAIRPISRRLSAAGRWRWPLNSVRPRATPMAPYRLCGRRFQRPIATAR